MRSNEDLIYLDKTFLVDFVIRRKKDFDLLQEIHNKNWKLICDYIKKECEIFNSNKKENFWTKLFGCEKRVFIEHLFGYNNFLDFKYDSLTQDENYMFYKKYIKHVLYLKDCDRTVNHLKKIFDDIENLNLQSINGNFYYTIEKHSNAFLFIKNQLYITEYTIDKLKG
jgi:hypothetical protein